MRLVTAAPDESLAAEYQDSGTGLSVRSSGDAVMRDCE
jgi:hypothetical protein